MVIVEHSCNFLFFVCFFIRLFFCKPKYFVVSFIADASDEAAFFEFSCDHSSSVSFDNAYKFQFCFIDMGGCP